MKVDKIREVKLIYARKINNNSADNTYKTKPFFTKIMKKLDNHTIPAGRV